MTTDQRQHQRHKIALAVDVTAPEASFTATTRDVSTGGCCIECAYPLPEGGSLDVALYLVVDGIEEASLPPLSVAATVQWAAENDEAAVDARFFGGLKFVDISPEQVQWLEGVIARTAG